MQKSFTFIFTAVFSLIVAGCSSVKPPPPETPPIQIPAVPEKDSQCRTNICEGYVNVTGGRVWFRAVGVGKKGIPLLVLHGGPGATHDYLEVVAALANERPVVFYDQLGCGKSDRPEDKSLWTVERYVEEVHQVREALSMKKLHILGQSWGSMLAIEYYLKHPEGVKSLMFSGPVMSAGRFVADQQLLLKKMPPGVRSAVDKANKTGDYSSKAYQDAVEKYYRRHVCQLSPWPEPLTRSMDQLNSPLYEYMWGPSEFKATGILKDFDRIAALGKVGVPVLYTCGDKDEAAPSTCAMYSDRTPRAEVVVFGDATHSHHLEHPETYIRVLRNFLRKVR